MSCSRAYIYQALVTVSIESSCCEIERYGIVTLVLLSQAEHSTIMVPAAPLPLTEDVIG